MTSSAFRGITDISSFQPAAALKNSTVKYQISISNSCYPQLQPTRYSSFSMSAAKQTDRRNRRRHALHTTAEVTARRSCLPALGCTPTRPNQKHQPGPAMHARKLKLYPYRLDSIFHQSSAESQQRWKNNTVGTSWPLVDFEAICFGAHSTIRQREILGKVRLAINQDNHHITE